MSENLKVETLEVYPYTYFSVCSHIDPIYRDNLVLDNKKPAKKDPLLMNYTSTMRTKLTHTL